MRARQPTDRLSAVSARIHRLRHGRYCFRQGPRLVDWLSRREKQPHRLGDRTFPLHPNRWQYKQWPYDPVASRLAAATLSLSTLSFARFPRQQQLLEFDLSNDETPFVSPKGHLLLR